MFKKLILIGFALSLLTSCGYQGQYRYPCQDPANWETPECKPPVCEVLGTCPEYLVGEDVVNPPKNTTTTDGTTNND